MTFAAPVVYEGWTAPGRVRRMVDAAAKAKRLTSRQILSGTRQRTIAYTRFAVMLAAHRTGASYAGIGRVLNRDHSTIITGSRRAETIAAASPDYAAFVAALEAVA